VEKGLTIGHEPVGVIARPGSAVRGYEEGQRVIAGAITPSGWSNACLGGRASQDGAGTRHGWKAMGGWRFGNTIATALCPRGKERMRRLMAVVAAGRVDLGGLVTHRFKLDDIERPTICSPTSATMC
jgi:threonine dehydrogenase-like Zn-dependent dehydrogenase